MLSEIPYYFEEYVWQFGLSACGLSKEKHLWISSYGLFRLIHFAYQSIFLIWIFMLGFRGLFTHWVSPQYDISSDVPCISTSSFTTQLVHCFVTSPFITIKLWWLCHLVQWDGDFSLYPETIYKPSYLRVHQQSIYLFIASSHFGGNS